MAQVVASDGDVGNNAAVSFRIQRGAFQDFALNGSSGVLTVARALDYDKRDNYAIGMVFRVCSETRCDACISGLHSVIL